MKDWSTMTDRERDAIFYEDAARKKTWADMTPREQDAALALAIGYTPCGCSNPECDLWAPPDHLNDGQSYRPFLSFTTSLDAMRLVEEEIEKRGFDNEYVAALRELQPRPEFYKGLAWRLMRSTPAQRAEAAYTVLRDAHAATT